MDKDQLQIVEKIISTRKYKSLYPKTVERIVENVSKRYPNKQIEKETKKVLHQVWDSYYTSRPDFKRLLANFQNFFKWQKIETLLLPLLQIHSSTKERIDYLDEFYSNIFETTGNVSSILDLGCGLNPLTVPWMKLNPETSYKAYDIDMEEVDFLNQLLKIVRLDDKVEVKAGDALIDYFPYADLVFMFKLLQPLEMQEKGSSIDILKKLDCRFIAVSFPTRSISGKDKGMGLFYEEFFRDLTRTQNWQITKFVYPNELVFVVKK